jgi:outer membrane protein OmpA-like peptidoglycan-associated protein
MDLLAQLERAEKALAGAQARADQAGRQIAEFEQRLAEQAKVQDILSRRVDNLLRENHELHQEMTAIVMNAAATTAPVAAIQQVGAAAHAGVEIPKSMERSLAGLADNNAGVVFDPRERVVRMASVELFEQGDVLRPAGKAFLKKLADALNSEEAGRFNFLIVGHAAPYAPVPRELVPNHPTKWHLSAHQAIAVQQYLEECGLSATRVGIVSYGSQQPLTDGRDEASNRTNSRVEIFVTPPDPPASRS